MLLPCLKHPSSLHVTPWETSGSTHCALSDTQPNTGTTHTATSRAPWSASASVPLPYVSSVFIFTCIREFQNRRQMWKLREKKGSKYANEYLTQNFPNLPSKRWKSHLSLIFHLATSSVTRENPSHLCLGGILTHLHLLIILLIGTSVHIFAVFNSYMLLMPEETLKTYAPGPRISLVMFRGERSQPLLPGSWLVHVARPGVCPGGVPGIYWCLNSPSERVHLAWASSTHMAVSFLTSTCKCRHFYFCALVINSLLLCQPEGPLGRCPLHHSIPSTSASASLPLHQGTPGSHNVSHVLNVLWVLLDVDSWSSWTQNVRH